MVPECQYHRQDGCPATRICRLYESPNNCSLYKWSSNRELSERTPGEVIARLFARETNLMTKAFLGGLIDYERPKRLHLNR